MKLQSRVDTFRKFAFLADENIHPAVVEDLLRRGVNVVTTLQCGLVAAADGVILRAAFESNRVVLTHDSDFGRRAVARGEPLVGIVYLRPGHSQPAFTIDTLSAVLTAKLSLTGPFLLVASRSGEKARIRLRSLWFEM
jgi:predicted nuclease of predicted toxin-antitoxin system